jgi:hypothetical protein
VSGYRIHRDVVKIIAVTNAARDIPTFLRHREGPQSWRGAQH